MLGLNLKVKHSLVFDFLRRYNPHIILLQEIRLQGSRVMALKRANVMQVAQAEYLTYSRGVAIPDTKKVNIHNLHIKTDTKG